MAKYINQAQMDELEEACSFGIEYGHSRVRIGLFAGVAAGSGEADSREPGTADDAEL